MNYSNIDRIPPIRAIPRRSTNHYSMKLKQPRGLEREGAALPVLFDAGSLGTAAQWWSRMNQCLPFA